MTPTTPSLGQPGAQALGAAIELTSLGFSVIPIPHKTKRPNLRDWPALRLSRDDLPRHFPAHRAHNIGILLGSGSVSAHGVLVDVDIDDDALVARADELLPPTGAVFGRGSRPRTHRLYWCPDARSTAKWTHWVTGTLVELRSHGSQTIAPGSTHPDGEAVRWEESANCQPSVASWSTLVEAINVLTGVAVAGPPTPADLGAFGSVCAAVRSAPEGARNDTLFRAACSAGRLVGAGRLEHAMAMSRLMGAALASGLAVAEARDTVQRGLAGGIDDVRRGVVMGGRGTTPTPNPSSPSGAFQRLCGFPPGNVPDLVELNQIEPQTLTWLWEGVLPAGKLSCIAGDPGLGKSFITLDLAARVTRGWPMPPAAVGEGVGECRQPGEVILISAEDDPADTIRPRLAAAGADLTRVSLLRGVRREQDTDADPSATFTLECVRALEAALVQRPGTKLIVIDPVTAYFPPDRDSHRQTDVRALLAPLSQLAQEKGVAIVLVAHLNKEQALPHVYRVSGSLALPAACRAVWLVQRDKQDADRRTITAAKMNLSNDDRTLAYRVEDKGGVVRVRWE